MNSTEKNKSSRSSHKVNKSTFAIAVGTFLSRITGFARDMIIGFLFTRTETDAFFVAFRFPNFFRRFFGEGALTVSFVPVFIECLSQEGDEKAKLTQAKNLVNGIYTLLLIVVSSVTVLGVFFMGPIVEWMFGSYEFSQVPGKMAMTTALARVLFFYLFLVVTYAYYMAIANALNRFFIPALAPAVFNLAIVLSALVFPKDQFVYPSMVLVIGVLAGGFLQMFMVMMVLFRLKFFPVFQFSFSSKDISMVLARFLPAVIGVGGFALMGLLNVFFAGWLEEGAHTAIYYADRLLELPRSLVAVSMGTALLPTLSKFVAEKKVSSLLELAGHQRDLLLYIIAPSALGLFILGEPIISALFERGRFDVETTAKTSDVLKIYGILLIILSLTQVLSTCFFAVKNTWYPALSTVSGLLVHSVLAPFLIPVWGLEGLVWSTVFSSLVQLLILFFGYEYFIGSFYLERTVTRFNRVIPVLFLFGIYIGLCFNVGAFALERFLPEGWAKGIALFFTLFSSVGLYGWLGWKFRLVQNKELWILLKSRWAKYTA